MTIGGTQGELVVKFELEPYNRDTTEEELLADLRAVAQKLKTPSLTQSVYNQHGRFCAATYKKRFRTWNTAVGLAGLVPAFVIGVGPEALIADIKRIAQQRASTSLTGSEYSQHGQYSGFVIRRAFGSWSAAASAAGLKPGWNYDISDEDLFDNLERVWRHLGRQPRRDEMTEAGSLYASGTYAIRFGGFRKALEAFVGAVDQRPDDKEAEAPVPIASPVGNGVQARKHRTPRTINWRLRFLTLRRDGYRCKTCGRSPAKEPGVELHVDHVLAWEEWGETELQNLQSLCEKCNIGKSNLPFNTP